MTEMEIFRHNASRLGLCDTYAQKWDGCRSKRQLFDLATDINSLSYIAETTAKGYGLTSKFIHDEFSQFINGRYISSHDGYTSAIYCLCDNDEITVNTTAVLIIGFNGLINIPANRPCELHLCQCKADIVGEGNGVVYLYDSEVVNASVAPVIIKKDTRY